jgi:hypothetical protein
MDGGPFRPAEGHVVASNGRVHEEMLAAIRDTPPGEAARYTRDPRGTRRSRS